MKKPVKILLWIFVIIFGGAILLFLSSPLWLGPLAKSLATSLAPKYTGTDFKVAKIYINPYTGCLRVEDFHLGNPKGYDAEDAVSVGKFNVGNAGSPAAEPHPSSGQQQRPEPWRSRERKQRERPEPSPQPHESDPATSSYRPYLWAYPCGS